MKNTFLKELNKQAKINEKRWEEIDKLVELLKPRTHTTETQLLLAIVELLRPPAKQTEQINEAQKELEKLMGNLEKITRSAK